MTAPSSPWVTVHRCVLTEDPRRETLYVRGGTPSSRTAFVLEPGERASFDTYFGGFPASYWAAHTPIEQVRLTVRVEGSATVTVRATDSDGVASTLSSVDVTAETARVDVHLNPDLAWLWAEVTAGTNAATIHDVAWQVPEAPRRPVHATVAVTTFDREQDCIRLLARLATSFEDLDAVVVADQGTRRLRTAPGFEAVGAALGARLRVLEQPNLGGSGGFSRGMIEALEAGSTHVLLLDDDVDIEPESLSRLMAFSAHATDPLVVGAQMLSLVEPTRLHSFGERVSRRGFWWGPVVPALSSVDLADASFERTPELNRRIDVDFNGWWMCLIPTSLIAAEGASLPFFIKWDDAEFGLRAAARGVRTVTLPGAALWHMPWTAKDDGLDWQAYFQLRNRVLTAMLHGRRRGGGVLSSSLAQDLNHVLCGQYGSAAVRNGALRDILTGPGHLDPVLAAGPARAARIMTAAGQSLVAEADLPPGRAATVAAPRGAAGLSRLAAVLVHQVRRPRGGAETVRLRRAQGKWWALGMVDSAVVESASGRGGFVMRRDRGVARRELAAAIGLRLRLWATWPTLARDYRRSAPEQASLAAWRRRFAESAAQGTPPADG